eukprot:TRINITY_DN941_c0_g1_i1.p1 TRINITY_DN941_c0_g1~~TRINITY_DN941_c0_g1_i1.p1  ORF type:complete len:149 (-),score=20.66 TRINITY_DN941_c0_g1_i1:64-510(-)
MFGWLLVVFILIANIILLGILLLPMPVAISRAVVHLISTIKKPLWVLLLVLTAVLASSWMDMSKAEQPFRADNEEVGTVQKEIYMHNKKWRSERNFYLVAYTWTLLVILLRCHGIINDNIDLKSENNALVTARKDDKKLNDIETKKDK